MLTPTTDFRTHCLQNAVQDKALIGWEYTALTPFVFPVPKHLSDKYPLKPYMVKDGWLAVNPPTRATTSGGCFTLQTAQFYSTDGCTGVPDFFRGWYLSRALHELGTGSKERALAHAAPYVAHWCHDALYQFSEELARHLSITRSQVIRLADDLFLWHMTECGGLRPDRDIYYWGVRTIGNPYNLITGLFRKKS